MDILPHLKQLIELLITKHVKGAIAIIAILLLALPADKLPRSLAQFTKSNEAYIWLTAAFCTLLIILPRLEALRSQLLHRIRHHRTERRMQQTLRTLSNDEKQLLRQFAQNGTRRTQAFLDPCLEPTQRLIDLGVIHPESTAFVSIGGCKQSFLLSAAARKALNQNGKPPRA